MATISDDEILNALVEDADRARKTIAANLGVSEPQLSKRIAALEESGVIKRFQAEIEYGKVGFNTHAVTLFAFRDKDPEVLKTFATRLMQVTEAIEVYSVFGGNDVYVRWLCRSPAQLMALVNSITDSGIQQLQTITLGQEFKRTRGPKLSPP